MVHTSATSAGLQQSLDLLAPEGTVIDLSWYGDTEVTLSLGGAFHPDDSASARARSARPPGPPRTPHDPRPFRPRPRPAPGPAFTRSSPALALRGAARGDGPAGRGKSAGALPHDHLRRGVDRVQRDRPRSHDDRPQPAGRGVRAGPAAARRDVRGRRHLPPRSLDADGIVVDIGRAAEELQAVVAELPTATSTTSRPSPEGTRPPRCWPG